MTADAILNFNKSGILDYSCHCMTNVYRRTKLEANIFINN